MTHRAGMIAALKELGWSEKQIQDRMQRAERVSAMKIPLFGKPLQLDDDAGPDHEVLAFYKKTLKVTG